MNDNLISILDTLSTAAEEAFNLNEIPVAAVVVDKNNNIVGIGSNNRQNNKSVIGHAEILAILDAENNIGDWRLDGYDMYVTLEPCHMCIEVIKESRLDNIYYICNGKCLNDLPSNFIKLNNINEYEYKFNNLLTSFFDNMR